SEQLGLEKLRRQRRTVHLYPGMLLSGRRGMKGSCDQILPNPALAADQDGGVRARHLLDDAPDGSHPGAVVERVRVVCRLVARLHVQGRDELQADPPSLLHWVAGSVNAEYRASGATKVPDMAVACNVAPFETIRLEG